MRFLGAALLSIPEIYLPFLLSSSTALLNPFREPFKCYVSMFLAFLGPPTNVSINSTVNQLKLPFSDPTHPPLCWRNTWMVPYVLCPLKPQMQKVIQTRLESSFEKRKGNRLPTAPLEMEITLVPSMFFYPDFILIFFKFYPDFILNLFWFNLDFIQILSRFFSKFYPDFILKTGDPKRSQFTFLFSV